MQHAIRRAMTLVELLVVMAIIGVLTALLLPAVQNSRAATRRAVCQSNLRQWTIAVLRYTDDHQGAMPRRGQGVQPTDQFTRRDDWFNALPPYAESTPLADRLQLNKNAAVDGIWWCPELVPGDKPMYFAYGMNMWLGTWKGGQPDNIAKIGPLSTMVFMADGPGTYCPDARHHGLVNVAFLDGHVAAWDGTEVWMRRGAALPRRHSLEGAGQPVGRARRSMTCTNEESSCIE
jgi:prepilin-type N-terminal cleavage/methylation domain-containing protein/prepilin-type processing-associated H-X9-DG protein